MNPIYKYPLIGLLGLVVIGLGYLVYRNLPHTAAEKLSNVGEALSAEATPDGGVSARQPPGTAAGGTVQRTVQPIAVAPASPATRALLDGAKAKLQQGELLAARKSAEAALAQPDAALFSAVWFEAARLASQANTALFNSDAPAPEKIRYEVKSGDNLVKISKSFNSTVEGLMRGNKNLNNGTGMIHPGMVILAYKGDWRIEVYKSKFVLLVYDGNRLFKLYDVAIGKQSRTPTGTFVINNKLREPAWTPPGKNIPYGDPQNVLGTRWLSIKPTGNTDPTLRGFGIHGTWEPESIGTAASEGCVRMRNDDVNELFDLVPAGISVSIKD